MAKAWLFQDDKQVKKHGEQNCSWYCGWYEAGQKRCKSFGLGSQGKKDAFRFQVDIERQITLGQIPSVKVPSKWDLFVKEYMKTISNKGTLDLATRCLDTFMRVARVKDVRHATTHAIDMFKVNRLKERGRGQGSVVASPTVNKELRVLRAALRKAKKWKVIADVPDITFLDEPQSLIRYVPPEHFASMFEACQFMIEPVFKGVDTPSWWRALITTCYLTGWRISEVKGVRRDDLDFEERLLIGRYCDAKRPREEIIRVNPAMIEVLRPIWLHNEYPLRANISTRRIYDLFAKLQDLAEIKLKCRRDHAHHHGCFRYGFHDLRRGFATNNVNRVTAAELQKLMKHKSFATTQKYVNMAEQVLAAEKDIYVPDILKPASKSGGISEGQPKSGKSRNRRKS